MVEFGQNNRGRRRRRRRSFIIIVIIILHHHHHHHRHHHHHHRPRYASFSSHIGDRGGGEPSRCKEGQSQSKVVALRHCYGHSTHRRKFSSFQYGAELRLDTVDD